MVMEYFPKRVAGAAAGVPSGGVIIWTGTIANIPSGYVICDGNNSTPNLLTRFVEGVATAATNPGTTGGATKKTLDETQGSTAYQTNSVYVVGYPGAAGADKGLWAAYGSTATGANVRNTITDIRPLFYDVAFIMKT